MANERLLFPNMSLVKKEITERFLVATQEVYRRHPVYTFEDNQDKTNIVILPSYGDVETPGTKPKIVLKSGGYQLDYQDSFYDNMRTNVSDSDEQSAGFTHWKLIDNTVTAIIRAYAEEESSDLADELASLVAFSCKGMYSQVGLDIRRVQVSETELSDKSQNIFQTAVSISLIADWEYTKQGTDYVDDVTVDPPELPEELRGSYRQPGVTVFDK